jgi:hypothetical protein
MYLKQLKNSILGAATVLGIMCAAATANAATFTSLTDYNTAVGAHSIITFQGLADGTTVTNQFSALGASFDGDDVGTGSAFVTDGIGIRDGGSATITFSSLMNHFGVEFPGAVTIQLFLGTALLSSTEFGGEGLGFFGGVLEAGGFDKVVLFDHLFSPGVYDNIHFGSTVAPVPIPAALPLFAAGLGAMGVFGWRKKRKSAA